MNMRTSDLIEEYLINYIDFIPASQIKKDLKLSHNGLVKGLRQLSYRNLIDIDFRNTKKYIKLINEV